MINPSTDPANFHRRWWWMAGLQALLLLHMFFYLTRPERVLTAPLLALAGFTTLLALTTFAVARWLNTPSMRWAHNYFHRFGWLYLLVVIVILAILGWTLRPEWFYAQLVLTTSAVFSLAYVTFFATDLPPTHSRVWIGAAALIVIGVVGLRIYALSVDPPIHIADEGWTLNRSVTYLRTGQLEDNMLLGIGGGAASSIGLPRLYVLWAFWLRLVGIGLWEARLFTIVLALGLTAFTVLAARNLYGSKTAFFAGGMLLASMLLISALRIRHDIGLALALAAGLWFYSRGAKTGQKRWYFWAGVVVGLGGFAHYHVVLFGVAMAMGLYGPRIIQRWRSGKVWPEADWWLFVTGGVLGGLGVFVVQILPQWDTLWTHTSGASVYKFNLQFLVQNTVGIVGNLANLSRPEFSLIALGLGAALWRGQEVDRKVAITLILSHLALSGVQPSLYYLIPLLPLYALLVGSLFSRGLERISKLENESLSDSSKLIFVLFMLPLLANTLVTPITYLLDGGSLRRPPPAAAQWIIVHVAPNDLVVADHYYYLWLTDYRFASATLPFLLNSEIAAQYPTYEALWDEVQPDVFIFDPNLATFTLGYLLESDYLQTHGYELAVELPQSPHPVLIYWRR